MPDQELRMPPEAVAQDLRMLIEPQYMRPEITRKIPGSDRTIIAPAIYENGELKYLTRADRVRYNISLTRLEEVARKKAAEELAKLKPVYVKDDEGVIHYAILDSESPFVASTVLCPEFGELFADTLGPDLLVAIPCRFRVYVFPTLPGAYEAMTDYVLGDFHASTYPVSPELFEWKNGSVKAIGLYEYKP